jgi:D-alanyl-lipoteichoic acid acyltransferase DltB (MBOAT superfamily)
MDTASIQFVFFGLVVALVSNLSRSRVWRSAVLMVASLLFLALLANNPIVLLPLAGFLLLGYGGLALLQRGWSKSLVWSILGVLAVYVWLKKYTFLPEGIFLHAPYFTLGLSYIFFRELHLLIETGDGGMKQRIGLGSYLLYCLNFATLISGPIQRYDEFARDQFAGEPIPLDPGIVGLQLERIVRGFFKVNVLALILNSVQEDAVGQIFQPLPVSLKLVAAFRLTVAYPFFLYANFSGYIDIVTAIARLLRIQLPENFNRPFSATSFLDFWSRWHITLSTWFRNYVYNPMMVASMRRISSLTLQPYLAVIAFFITFFLVGVWHGRTSEFILYGVLQGAGVAVNKLWQVALAGKMGRKKYNAIAKGKIYTSFARGLTFSWFALSLFWFWADWSKLSKMLAAIGTFNWIGVWLTIWLTATIVLAGWEWIRAVLLSLKTARRPILTNRYARVIYASALGFVAIVMLVLLSQPAPGIVYKAF